MFGCPDGIPGRLGGVLLARGLGPFNAWVVGLLGVGQSDRILEVGFGPGVAIRLLADAASEGHVAGVDPSPVMLRQARARNAAAISAGQVDLRIGVAGDLPFGDQSFDAALSVNSMQIWPDPVAGLSEIRRLLRPGGRVALGFTPVTGQTPSGVTGMAEQAGFTDAEALVGGPSSLLEGRSRERFCVLAVRR